MVTYNATQDNERKHPMDCFFAPRAVAVIGASERPGSVGRNIFWNLISSPFGGSLYAVNPRHSRVLGIRTLSSVMDAPEALDLALIVTPASTVPSMVDECMEAGVKGAIIISAGFSERGEPGYALEREIRARTETEKIRIIGPNSLGIMNPVRGLNAAYAAAIARKGTVGFISQSGAVSASILDWSLQVKTGFSAFVSFGAMVDVNWSDIIYYLGSDPNTRSILIYMESLGNARSFLSAAREVALTKPIIVLKTDQTGKGALAIRNSAYLDTSDTADDEVLSAALLRSGVLRVDSIDTLFSMADVLGKQPRPKGPRLTIISNATGPAVLATDALVDAGGALAQLSDATMAALDATLPSYWNRNNPVDIVADADPDRYVASIERVTHDENSDGLLVLLAPQVTSDPTGTARAIAAMQDFGRKPVLAAWMGGETVAEGVSILNENLIPTFPYPDQAARLFAAMWRYSYAMHGLYEMPEPYYDAGEVEQRNSVSQMIRDLRQKDIRYLSDVQTKQLLTAYGIAVAQTHIVHTEEEALAAAASLGYPVAMQPNITTSDGSLRSTPTATGFINADEVRTRFRMMAADSPDCIQDGIAMRPYFREQACYLVLEGRVDPQFGPYIIFRAGGATHGTMPDQAFSLPPLNTTLARRTMERTRIYEALYGKTSLMASNATQLEQILVRFSSLILAEPMICDIEINPLLAGPNKVIALDAHAALYPKEKAPQDIPQPAIRPYPSEYCLACTLKNGDDLLLRPIRPEDEMLMVKFHKTLSDETVYFRYLHLLSLDQRIRHDRISQMCFIDYDRQIGLVAVHTDSDTGEPSVLAIARLVRIHGADDADFALAVSDRSQGLGIGTLLLTHLLKVARAEGMVRVTGVIHPENRAMLRLCEKVGFLLSKQTGDEVRAEYKVGSQ